VDRTGQAKALFAPLGPTYERAAAVLSLGQDARWRRFLVSQVEAGPDSRVLDVATGTGLVARALVRAHGCSVVGLDQSAEMLAEARRRADSRIELVEGAADALPFADAEFDALTFTYLLRYVDDPAATLRELARVVRPGGTMVGLEFGVPRLGWRPLWELYVRIVLPLAGRALGEGWREAGSFLGPSIREFGARWPPKRLAEAWGAAGLERVQTYRLSLGGAVVTWGRRA
jgi:demethylmenaquinone methyltransferase/2-methoxy-6-polyprenyl-1,4-benzoquinol methylase